MSFTVSKGSTYNFLTFFCYNYSPTHNSRKRVRYGFIVVKVNSYDVRKKVMEALDEGENYCQEI
ncbi:hypothetical protein Wcon_01455 [Wolbachia endosymbiont of Cylisticus convexus]|nr:hypothetical protein Wcon_01455 [Wolbachia endosymbiont of Cylisticus convexus]